MELVDLLEDVALITNEAVSLTYTPRAKAPNALGVWHAKCGTSESWSMRPSSALVHLATLVQR